MRLREFSAGPDLFVIAAVIGGLDLVLESISLFVRYERLAPEVAASLTWRFDAGVTLPLLLLIFVYLLGSRQPVAASEQPRASRHLAFFAGIALIYFVLQSPFDAIADRLFVAHQVQHMTLGMVAPMLIVLAAPQATLLRGLPHPVRRHALAPLFGSGFFRALRAVAWPGTATALYIATNYFWMVPRVHDAALANERLHDLLHFSLLIVGLVFFWRVLDPRPSPVGPSLGARLFMFWLAAVADILLGSFLAFKHVVLYSAYGPSPHLFGIAALDDECYGGLTMWIPGSGMLAVAAILTVRRYAADEERRSARRPRLRETPAEFVARRGDANRRLALGLLAFAAVVLLIMVGTVLFYHYGLPRALLAPA